MWQLDYLYQWYVLKYINFTFIGPCCIVTNFFIIKPTRYTNLPNLLQHETLHVSDSSSVHHQEFIHCTLGTGMCLTGLKTAFNQDQDGVPSWSECTVNKLLMMGRGTARNM